MPSRTACTYFLAGFSTLGIITMVYLSQVSDVYFTSYTISSRGLTKTHHEKHDPRLKFKSDLPVLYLSDFNEKDRQKLLANVSSRRTAPSGPGRVMRNMLKNRLQDDYRFCRKETPFVGPFDYLPNTKSPCWKSESGSLHCIPFFFLTGFSKSGTTDLFSRITAHPDIMGDGKEKHWLDYMRYFENKDSIYFYASSFSRATSAVERNLKDVGRSNATIGDGTPCYAWDSLYWPCYEGNRGLTEPKYTNVDVIYRMNPNAKIIMLLRDPVKRLYSRYLTFINLLDTPSFTDPSPYKFHQNTKRAIRLYTECFKEWSHRHCAYNGTLYRLTESRLQEGMYSVYIKDWLRVFPRKQLLIMKFEDYVTQVPKYLHKIYEFLEVSPLSDATVKQISKRKAANVGRNYYVGPLMDETKEMLRQFYAPFNRDLQQLLEDSSWGWGYE